MKKKLYSILTASSCCPFRPRSTLPLSAVGDAGQSLKLKVAFIIPGFISYGTFGALSYPGVQSNQRQDFIKRADYVQGIAPNVLKAIRD